jgi:hypothetical protein
MTSGLLPGDIVTGENKHHPPLLLVECFGEKHEWFSSYGGDIIDQCDRYELWSGINDHGQMCQYSIKEASYGRIVPLNRSIESVFADM